MLINEIPDDCLLAIFDYLNSLEDLINCYKVCVKWSYLIAKRAKKTKYLIDQSVTSYSYDVQKFIFSDDIGYASDTVYYRESPAIDSTCLNKLFTNLTVVELSSRLHCKAEDAIEFVKNQKSLKGLINNFNLMILGESIEKYCDKLEMLSVDHFNPNYLRNGSSIKQLYLWEYSLEAFGIDAHYVPNIERLKIQNREFPEDHYHGPVLEKLKILEFYYYYDDEPEIFFYGFHLMDSCPNLQSAHIAMNAININWFFDETLKHKCLQELVITSAGYDDEGDDWNNLKRLLMKYPNLKHLALRGFEGITDENIGELVHILPNLVLLDVRGCDEVTQEAADYVKDYCERNERSIKFYFDGNCNEIKSDWVQLSTKHEKISRGFDFMKHCFRKDFNYLSHFLIPID